MNLRPAVPGDASAVTAVARESWHAAYGDFLPSEVIDDTVDEWYDPPALRRALDGGLAYVCEADGECVCRADGEDDGERDGNETTAVQSGVVAFAQGRATDEAAGELRRIYARKSHWGTGVGSALLGRVATDLRARGHDTIRAVVFADNTVGRAFYDAKGFVVCDRQTDTFGGETYEDVIVEAPLDTVLARTRDTGRSRAGAVAHRE